MNEKIEFDCERTDEQLLACSSLPIRTACNGWMKCSDSCGQRNESEAAPKGPAPSQWAFGYWNPGTIVVTFFHKQSKETPNDLRRIYQYLFLKICGI